MKRVLLLLLAVVICVCSISCTSKEELLEETFKKEELSEETFKKVVEKYGYTTSIDEEGDIVAEKGMISLFFNEYESVEISNEEYEAVYPVLIEFCESKGYTFLSYGQLCSGYETDSSIMLVAHKDNMGIVCFAYLSHKAEIEAILDELGLI